MSELWPRASLHLPERGRGEKRQQVNKTTHLGVGFSLPLHPTHFEAAVQKMSKIQSSFFFYIPFCQVFLFSPPVQMETDVWWHIWGTLKQPEENRRARSKKKKRMHAWELAWVLFLSLHVPMCILVCAWYFFVFNPAAGVAHCSA